MKEHDFIIEQILMDAKAGQMVDESAWSKLKGWGAAAAKTAQNIGTGVSNLRKSAKAGWKNTMGKLAGGATHDAAKAETENKPFALTGDSFPKIIVRHDIRKRWYDDNGILNIGVIDFLLDESVV